MRDLTQGPIPGHLVAMAAPIAAGMLAQTLYFLIDLYFVAQLGDAALAGVGAAGIAMFVVMALTQTLGVGTMALVSQAVGRKDPADADVVFNQSLSLAMFCTAATIVGGYALAGCYMQVVGADAATVDAGVTYLWWFMPGLALQYVNIVMMSGLRGTGVVKPTMIVQIVTVLLNAFLAPVLIAGWLTGRPMGVAGAGLASTISVAVGTVLLGLYFHKLEKYRPHPAGHVEAAAGRVGSHGEHRPACGRRVRIHVPVHGGDLLGDPRLWRGGPGGFRARHAAHAVGVPAGDGYRLRDRADRRAELRREAIRARARDLRRGREDQCRGHDRADAPVPDTAGCPPTRPRSPRWSTRSRRRGTSPRSPRWGRSGPTASTRPSTTPRRGCRTARRWRSCAPTWPTTRA